jgi:hypothetical protein
LVIETEILEMTDVYIRTSFATAHCVIATSGVVATEIDNREKAVQFQTFDESSNSYRTFWLPKKALKLIWERNNMKGYELAKWFKVEGYIAFIFERCSSTLVSAA